MRGLTKQVTVKVLAQFTARDWQLYTSHGEAADLAARILNEKLSECVNAGLDRGQVSMEMWRTMRCYETLGATDTEPREFLESVLDKIFEDN